MRRRYQSKGTSMTDKETMKMALEFIERVNKEGWILDDFEPQMYQAIAALKERLAQPEQEPVAHVVVVGDMVSVTTGGAGLKDLLALGDGAPLYTTPQPQEFVCSTGLCHFTLTQTNVGIGERGMEAYEAAKKRGWVGLSDERLMKPFQGDES